MSSGTARRKKDKRLVFVESGPPNSPLARYVNHEALVLASAPIIIIIIDGVLTLSTPPFRGL